MVLALRASASLTSRTFALLDKALPNAATESLRTSTEEAVALPSRAVLILVTVVLNVDTSVLAASAVSTSALFAFVANSDSISLISF